MPPKICNLASRRRSLKGCDESVNVDPTLILRRTKTASRLRSKRLRGRCVASTWNHITLPVVQHPIVTTLSCLMSAPSYVKRASWCSTQRGPGERAGLTGGDEGLLQLHVGQGLLVVEHAGAEDSGGGSVTLLHGGPLW